ncbi:MAG: prolipoprotein diacylglyceryl transferase [Elusimicrobia bacterium]|nr:prolipoprotein diacylglyceryl transferase [Elusimicrobiota bacterium]
MRPVLWSFGPYHVFGYGAAILVGALVGTRLLWLRRDKMGLRDEESFWALINVGCLSGFLGGKLLFILQYGWHGALNLNNGYSVFGGFVSVPLAVWGFASWKKIPFLKLADYMFLTSFFWLAFGRLGCFLAGCCYGRPTNLPWGVVFTDPRARMPPELLGVRLHPVQLYEAAADLILAALLYRVLLKTERGEVQPGLVVAGHFACYGALRFTTEFLRADGLPFAGPVTQGQAFGLTLLLASGCVLLWRKRCSRSC